MKKNLNSSLTAKALAALQVAIAKAVEEHRRRRRLLAVWGNGEAVWIPVQTADASCETPIDYQAKG